MSVRIPVISLDAMRTMFPAYRQEAETIAEHGHWHYSVTEQKFLSYIPSLKVSVHGVTPATFTVTETSFNLRRLSSVYEVKTKDHFPSSLLLASNLAETVEKYLDITPSLSVLVLDSISAPIIMGNSRALERMIFPNREDSAYMLKPLEHFLRKGE